MVSFCWILALAAGAAAAPGSFRGHTVAVEDVKQSLHEMMKAMLDGQGSMAKQLEGIEASIWQSYQSLPKNEAGHIGSRAVRYLVHNYFAKEHGWLIKGLEPHGHQENMSEVHEVNILQDKAPLLVESLLEAHRSDRGLSLTDAVAMIATLERLIVDEASTLLQAAYTLNSFTTDEMLEESEMHEVLTSYLVLFELGKKANLNNKDIHRALKARAASVSHNWPFLVEFEHDALHNYLFERKNKRNPFVPIETFSFGDALQIVETLAGGYGKWQNAECQLMKRELMDIDEEGTGIIPLHRFYSQPEGADYHFTESREYLEKVGALQVTQRGSSYVRIANYMTGPSNCIASSSYYSVCCLNECEVLMNELESKILAPSTSPQRLLGLAANLSSATVDAPRDLPTVMEEKLHAIAARHGGEVPLHGRLFAQWMHHAFPHECPYPHIAEDTTVLVPSHWQNGKATVPLTERAELAEAHTPVLVETQNLSWSEEEVVVVRERPTRSHGPVRLLMQFALLLGLLHTILRSYKTMTFAEQGKAGSLELPF